MTKHHLQTVCIHITDYQYFKGLQQGRNGARIVVIGLSLQMIALFFLECILIQMSKNTIRKNMRQIVTEIDHQMNRIDGLLKILADKQSQSKSKAVVGFSKEVEYEWDNSDGMAEQNRLLNDTCEETDYNCTRAMTYNFEPIENTYDQEMLLDDSSLQSIYAETITLYKPKTLIITTKGNWINNFLDESDAKVMFDQEGRLITLKDIKKGKFICQSNDSLATKADILIDSEKIYKMESLIVEFPRHLNGYQLKLQVNQEKMLYQLTLREKARILVQCPNKSGKIIRFLLLKQENDDSYEIFWGAYSEETIFESIILEEGTYILLPLPGDIVCNLYLKDSSIIEIKKQVVRPLKSFNLLKKSFEESRPLIGLKRTLSLIPQDEQVKKQYGRSCYMNYGIILEFYQNIYEHQAKFVNETDVKEDLQLLFKEIYTTQQISHRLAPDQKIYQFFIITKKPANLFIPKKKVLVGNRFMENKTIHSVFR